MRMNDGMTIAVDTSALIESLTENRAEHERLYNEAQDKYRALIIEAMDRRLSRIKSGGEIKVYFGDIIAPKSFLESFDTALAMLKWHIGEQISLGQDDFERYVLDNWEWKQQFAASTGTYTTF